MQAISSPQDLCQLRDRVGNTLREVFNRDTALNGSDNQKAIEDIDRLADANIFNCSSALAELVMLDCVCSLMADCPEPKRLFDRLFHAAGSRWPPDRQRQRVDALGRLVSLSLTTATSGPLLDCTASWLKRHEGHEAQRQLCHLLADDFATLSQQHLLPIGQLSTVAPLLAEALICGMCDSFELGRDTPNAVLQLVQDWLLAPAGRMQEPILLAATGNVRYAEHSAIFCLTRWLCRYYSDCQQSQVSSRPEVDAIFASLLEACQRAGAALKQQYQLPDAKHAALRHTELAELTTHCGQSSDALCRLVHILQLALANGLVYARPEHIVTALASHDKDPFVSVLLHSLQAR